MNPRKCRIVPDDFQVGEFITVLQNRFGQHFPMGRSVKMIESDYLKGTVLRIVAFNLPYVLVQAADPLKGMATLSVDVRDHVFARVSNEYAEAVLACCNGCDHDGGEEPEME